MVAICYNITHATNARWSTLHKDRGKMPANSRTIGIIAKTPLQSRTSLATLSGVMCSTVEPLLYDHPQNHIGVVV